MSGAHISVDADARTIRCEGAVDMAALPALRTAASRLDGSICIDLRHATTIDDCAVGILLGLAERTRAAGADLTTIAGGTVASRLWRLGVDTLVNLQE
jgi:anti-anti-sigma regulatory factor